MIINKVIIRIIISVLIVLVGCIVFDSLIKINNLETNRHEISNNFNDIKIITDTADIVFVPTEELNSIVVCEEQKI